MKITVDEPACVAAGQCVMAAPEVFDQREEDGVVVLLTDEPSPDQEAPSREAALLCPAAAIHLSGA